MYRAVKKCFTHTYHQILSKMIDITIDTMSTVEFAVLAQNVVLDTNKETVVVGFLCALHVDIIIYKYYIMFVFYVRTYACTKFTSMSMLQYQLHHDII